MTIFKALGFTAVCIGVMVLASLRGRDVSVADHTMQSPLKLSFGTR